MAYNKFIESGLNNYADLHFFLNRNYNISRLDTLGLDLVILVNVSLLEFVQTRNPQ